MTEKRMSKAALKRAAAAQEVELVQSTYQKMMDIFEKSLGEGHSPRQAFMDAIDWLHDESDAELPQKAMICLGDRLDGVMLWVERENDRYCVVMLTDDQLKAQITLSLQGRQNAHKRALRIDCQAALNGNYFCRWVVSERIRRIAKG